MAKKSTTQGKKSKQIILITALSIIAVVTLTGFSWSLWSSTKLAETPTTNTTQPQKGQIQNVTVETLAEASGEYVIVDVREQWEYDRGHVPGVVLIPLGELQARASELPDNKPLYIICHSGVRSVTASDILLDAGKQDIRNVLGGTVAWARAGFDIEQ